MEGTRPIVMIMEGTKPVNMIMEGTRPPTGASPTQPYKCGQNVKVKVNVFISALAKVSPIKPERFDFRLVMSP